MKSLRFADIDIELSTSKYKLGEQFLSNTIAKVFEMNIPVDQRLRICLLLTAG